MESNPDNKRIIEQLREEIRMLKEKKGSEDDGAEDPPNFSLLQRRRTLPSVEDLMDEMSLEPYFVLEGIISECVNRIEKVAHCSNRMRGNKVHDLRMCARKIQAGGVLMASFIRNAGKGDAGQKRALELEKEVEDLKKENDNLKNMMEGLTE